MMGLFVFYVIFGIVLLLVKSYKFDFLMCGILVLMVFLVIVVLLICVFEDVDNVIIVGCYINLVNLGLVFLFGVIVIVLLFVEIYCFFIEKDIMIKMLDGVLFEVLNLFIVLILGVVIFLLFWVICYVIGFDLNGFLSMLLMLFKGIFVGNSLFGGLLIVFLICFFWVLGIYGLVIMGLVICFFWDMLIVENFEVFINGVNVY